MRILLEGNGALQHGFRRVLEACGHECRIWEKAVPAFDVFDEMEPDLYLSALPPTRAVTKCLEERSEDTEHVYLGPYFTFSEYYGQAWVDTFLYFPGIARPELNCDVAYVGPNDKNRVSRLLYEISPSSMKLKIFSSDEWQLPEALGQATIATERDIYASALISIAHSPASSLQISASGGFPLRVYETGYELTDMQQQIKEFSKPSGLKSRKKLIKWNRDGLYKNNTYWHAVHHLFETIGQSRAAELVKERQIEILGV